MAKGLVKAKPKPKAKAYAKPTKPKPKVKAKSPVKTKLKSKAAPASVPVKAKPVTPAKVVSALPHRTSKVEVPVAKVEPTQAICVGSQVPDFSLSSTAGHFVLSEKRGKKMVLYFYPKDSTPGCTIQGKEFSDYIEDFQKEGFEVYGISRDSIKSHDNFKNKQSFKIELLSDEDEIACRIFDVIKEKNMYGKKVWGIERSTFVLDEQGRLVAEWRKVKAEGHASEVLKKIKQVNK